MNYNLNLAKIKENMQASVKNKSQLRIAIISFEGPHDISGGVQRRVSAEINFFSKQEIDLLVLYTGKGNSFVEGTIKYVPIAVPNLIYPIQTIIFSIKVAFFISKYSTFDLIETHLDAGLALLLLRHLWHKKPCKVWTEFIHGVYLDEFKTFQINYPVFSIAMIRASALLPFSYIEKWAARSSDAVITVSKYAAARTKSLYSIPETKIYIIPNGIDTTIFCPSPNNINIGYSNPTKKFLFVGKLDPRKGILVLLKAFAKALKLNPSIELDVIGSGMQMEEAKKACQNMSISNHVHFLGKRKDNEIVEAYRSAYAVCMPSFQEGQGITALEAQACGTPVIASDVGGLPEAVVKGKTGILVTSGDSDALAVTILDLVKNLEKRNKLGENALEWSREFHWDIKLNKAFELYQRLINSQPF